LTGPEQEFGRFFRENCEQLVGLAYLWCGDRQDARDLAQETLVRAWEAWEALSTHPNPEAWARRVLHNLCTSRWRRRNLERSVRLTAEHVWAMQDPAEDSDFDVNVAKLVSKLAPKPRRALVLHDVLGLSVEEIAHEMGARQGTVRSWLSRSRQTLKSQLLDQGIWTGTAESETDIGGEE
jgi:RNA polymerase sigma-70 factor (ECF subfamily)